MQTPDNPHLHLLAENKLGAAPTLELLISCQRDDLPVFYDRFWHLVEQHQLIRMDGEARHLITHDQLLVNDFEPITAYSLSHAKAEFLKATEVGIRKQPATLLVIGRTDAAPEFSFANLFRISLGSNYFPDDPGVLSISLTATQPNAWESLSAFRDALLPTVDQILCWSTLGYGFVCNFEVFYPAAEQMQMLCMRYLGVDLQDPFGAFVIAGPWGLRTINWQVCVSSIWLAHQFPDLSERLRQNANDHLGYMFWQAADKASLCDRNDLKDHAAIAAYTELENRLSRIIYTPQWHWYKYWDEAISERWSTRWSEVEVFAKSPRSIN